ncbi:hypothetical protein [Tenacibaculum sp.]|uniref:hypothetical protein n=1 Tax=Tenacibaculum sp. TaxID=1906242 RepID=UPI003D0BBE04
MNTKQVKKTIVIVVLIVIVVGGKLYKKHHRQQIIDAKITEQNEWVVQTAKEVKEKEYKMVVEKANKEQDSIAKSKQEALKAKQKQLQETLKKIEQEQNSK